MGRLTAVTALLCVVGSTPVFAECSAADRAALQEFDVAWTKATNTGDTVSLTKMLSDNFGNVNVMGGGSKAGAIANSVRNAAANAANTQPQTINDHFTFICSTNTATILHRNVAPPFGTTTVPTYSRTLHVLEKKGGNWQVVSSMSHALTDQQTLTYIEQDWNDAWKNHDGAWVEKNYAPYFRGVNASTGAVERKADQVADAANTAQTFDVLELSDLSVRVDGDVAVVTGVNTVKGKDAKGKAMDEKHRFTDIFIRHDGQWQIWASQGTIIKP